MLHANPLLRDISCDKKFITVGENSEVLNAAELREAPHGEQL